MLLDSNIVIYAAKPEYKAARDFITKYNPAVSVISKVEVLGYHKLNSTTQGRLKNMFQFLQVLPLSDAIASEAISLRQQRKMSLGDALIAGTALANNLVLVTANERDFSWIGNLKVINPL